MKEIINRSTNQLAFILILVATVVFGCRCSSEPKPTSDPLAGWMIDFNHQPSQTIVKDYQNYIQHLSPEERRFPVVGPYFEDGAGQHAIKIEIDLDGTDWEHILIYDTNDNRIKEVKYVSGHSRS